MSEITIKIQGLSRRQLAVGAIGLAASLGLAVIGIVWVNQHMGLGVAGQQIESFKPYYYRGGVPAGFHAGQADISYDQGVLIVKLHKPGSPDVVLTEQALDNKLSPGDLQRNGESVSGTASTATINSVEGRLVGVMPVPSGSALIVLNAPESVNKADMAALLRGLRPVR